jgi:hypothetical protein
VEEIFFMENPLPWEGVINAHAPFTVIMLLNRRYLEGKLITCEEIKKRTDQSPCLLIPYVEVCYPEPIPLSVVEGHIVVYEAEPKIFAVVDEQSLSDTYLDRIGRIISQNT